MSNCRFRVKIEVSDGDATCVFVLFDTDMSYTMEKSCAHFVGQTKVSNGGSNPAEFECLVGKKMLCTIEKGLKQTIISDGTFRPISQSIDVDSDSSFDDVDVVEDSQPLSFMKDIIVTPATRGKNFTDDESVTSTVKRNLSEAFDG
ncbi:replication factor A protein, partial [Trifolium medium]|nr:replication factor A protein [Trifolium medium]